MEHDEVVGASCGMLKKITLVSENQFEFMSGSSIKRPFFFAKEISGKKWGKYCFLGLYMIKYCKNGFGLHERRCCMSKMCWR